MIYKTLKKVSDVCQLLDKSKYPATKTVGGITYTNNGDGTITINGTNTKRLTVPIYTLHKLHKSHFYIKRGRFSINYGYAMQIKDDFSLYKVSNNLNNAVYYYLPIGTYDNVIDKLQLFDLTEMYGAGNEPTTVEQFRQDFPNEMYDYKPYCFVKSYKTLLKASDDKIITSYKKSLVCKTKNLFGNNQVYKLENSTNKIIWQGEISERCVFSWYQLLNSLKNPSATLFQFNYSDGSIQYAVAKMDLISRGYISINSSASKKLTSIILLNWSFAKGSLYNLQLELGDTATDYVPYGHL